MEILINEKSQAQCPKCGQWNKLVDHDGLIHKFSCHETIVVVIDKENLEQLMNE